MKQHLIASTLALTITSSLLCGITLTAFAQTGTPTTSPVTTKATKAETARMTKLHDRANQEIDRRIKALTALSARVGEMKRIQDAQKTNIAAGLTAQISAMNDLKTKIAGDTDLTTLKTDVASVTESYRIFALILPEVNIIAAADRIIDMANSSGAIGTKLGDRLATAKSASNDTAAAEAKLADFIAKLTDATSQANTAASSVITLTPDNGDKAKMAANLQVLKDARVKVRAATADLVAARKDARDIVSALKKFKGTTATTTPAAAPTPVTQ